MGDESAERLWQNHDKDLVEHGARIVALEECRRDHEERLRKAEDRDAWMRMQLAEIKVGQDNQIVLLKEIKNGQDAQWRRIDTQSGRQERLEEQVKSLQKDQDRQEKRGDVHDVKLWDQARELAKYGGWFYVIFEIVKTMVEKLGGQ